VTELDGARVVITGGSSGIGLATARHARALGAAEVVLAARDRVRLVTAAAGTYRGTITDLDIGNARALFESKFWGQHHCVRHAAPLLRPGSITLFSGWISRKPMPATGTLATSNESTSRRSRASYPSGGPEPPTTSPFS
jgi:NAD(P)-dependent dehydrogenase (short-subunit alcohol dehydrogenase family)